MTDSDTTKKRDTDEERPHPEYDFQPATRYETPPEGCVLCEAEEFEPGYVPERIQTAHWEKYVGPDYASMRAELRELFEIEVSEAELREHDQYHVHHGFKGGADGF